jgi:hypothetical protein
MLHKLETLEQSLSDASHRSHLEITRQALTTSCLQADVLATQVDYLFRHFCVDFTSLNMAKKHSLI